MLVSVDIISNTQTELGEVTVDVLFPWPERGIVEKADIDNIVVKSAGFIRGHVEVCPEYDELKPPPEWLTALLEDYCWAPVGMVQILRSVNLNCQNSRWPR